MTAPPLFSVVVPTRGRPVALRECLGALAGLDPPREGFEVIVVDDGTPDTSERVVGEFRDRLPVRLFCQGRRGPGAARNTGARHANGRILAFMDDDCVPDAGWLTALERQFERTPDALVGGRVENGLPENPFSTASQLITSYTTEYYQRSPQAERFFTTNNFSVPAPAFAELGGFDTQIPAATAEDKEFCDRWRRRGWRLVYAAEAVVRHRHRLNLIGFCRQHYNYGRGILCFRVLRADGGRPRIRPEPVAFYFGLIGYPLRLDRGARGWLDTLLLMLAQAATAAGAVHASAVDLRRLRRARGRAALSAHAHGSPDPDGLGRSSDASAT